MELGNEELNLPSCRLFSLYHLPQPDRANSCHGLGVRKEEKTQRWGQDGPHSLEHSPMLSSKVYMGGSSHGNLQHLCLFLWWFQLLYYLHYE
jgi:hypothetical protein